MNEFSNVENDLNGRQAAIHGRIFQEIVVEYPFYYIYPEYKGKPYFSIKYTENGQECIGYGTYKPEVLSEYLKEYFMPSAQPEYKLDEWCEDCKEYDHERHCCPRFNRVIRETLEEIQAEQKPEQRWIPVTERLPEEGRYVLITKEPFKIKGYEREVIKAERSADPRSGKIEWWSPEFGTLTNNAVLAWMPLPEPYKKEGDE